MSLPVTIDESAQWSQVSKPDVPPYELYTEPIEKASQDDRDYRIIRLENGLEAMLVHDSEADTAAASLNVSVGYLFDPDDMPGLAHFCEHLLFMGSEPYPSENDFSQYLSKHNGSYNAFTAATDTRYHFSVAADSLSDMLPRFAAFFHSPLFSPSCVARELKAINAEHINNSQDDSWRSWQLQKHLSKEGHIWRKFGGGNIETLSKSVREDGNKCSSSTTAGQVEELEDDGGIVGQKIRSRLVEWWTREYSANRMHLCVVGTESLDILSDLVSNHFSPIQNRGCPPVFCVKEHPFGPNEIGTLVSVATIAAEYTLKVSFPFDASLLFLLNSQIESLHPVSFTSRLIRRGDAGSLHSYLKTKGWLTSSFADQEDTPLGFSTLYISMTLTQEGFDRHRDVLFAVFDYLSFLRSSTFEPWRHAERRKFATISFDFGNKESPENLAYWLSELMTWPKIEPITRKRIMKASDVPDEIRDPHFGDELIRKTLQCLQANNMRVVLSAKREEHERISSGLAWDREPIYGTLYHVERLDPDFINKMSCASSISPNHFFLPPPNEFLPNDLHVDRIPVETPAARPDLIRETPLSSLWHKKDDRFWRPKAIVMLSIRSPIFTLQSRRHSAINTIFCGLLADYLAERLYDAPQAGLSYCYWPSEVGAVTLVSGFSDHGLDLLLRKVLLAARNLRIDNDRLTIARDQQLRSNESFYLGDPGRVSTGYLTYCLYERDMSEPAEKWREALKSVTKEDIEDFISEFFSEVSIRTLVMGNLSAQRAVQLQVIAEEILKTTATETVPTDGACILPAGINHIFRADVVNAEEPNSALSYYVQLGDLSQPRLRAKVDLLTQILSEPAYNILRTKEQLGYTVYCQNFDRFPLAGLLIVVQSEHAPTYLEERVNAFLDTIKQDLEAMSDEEFEEHKSSVKKSAEEKPTDLCAETIWFWRDIEAGTMELLESQNNANLIPVITKQEVLDLFNTRVHHSSPSRSKLSIHLCSRKGTLQKLSRDAMSAFEESLMKEGICREASSWNHLFADGEPKFSECSAFWENYLSENTTPSRIPGLLATLKTLALAFPSKYAGKCSEDTVIIQDLAAFKSSLAVINLSSHISHQQPEEP